MDDIPHYYHSGSRLFLQLVNNDGSTTDALYTVDKAITPFTMAQAVVVHDSSGSQTIVKVYDPRFMSHRLNKTRPRPWNYPAEIAAAGIRRAGLASNFTFPDRPASDDGVGWEAFYYQHSDIAAEDEITAYRRLVPLQGAGIPRCLGFGTISLAGRAIAPRVLLLEYLPNAQSLDKINPHLITPDVRASLVKIASGFGRLGVVHTDLNYGNIIFVVGAHGIERAAIIDFGSSYSREDESDKDWQAIVDEQDDVTWLNKRLNAMLREWNAS